MTILLTLLSAAAAILFFAVLLIYLVRIVDAVERIGGDPNSSLARIRLGLQAIEVETGHLPPNLARLNQRLGQVGNGLEAVEEQLQATARAARAQGE